MKKAVILLAAALAFASCGEKIDKPGKDEGTEVNQTYHYVNMFGKGAMSTYYLWEKEIASDLASWKQDVEPIAYVKKIRYKQSGKDFDRWTQMTDDFEGFTSSVAGISETYGYDIVLSAGDEQGTFVVAIVTFVYKDSPAEKAGLKRGDIIYKINGKVMLMRNYATIVNQELFNSREVTLVLGIKEEEQRTVSLTAENMYEDPVVLYKTLQAGEKKVGYLVFTSFTLKCCERLIEAGKFFKAEGVKDLIIDLRYNGGGYVFTQQLLASILAPAANVERGDILETTVYNDLLTKYWGDGATKLSYQHEIEENKEKLTYDTSDANIGIEHLYAIIESGTASASESLLTCLMPYLPITIVGQQSHGKFCTGVPLGLTEWFEENNLPAATVGKAKREAGNWGIYVMIGRFADKNGDTPCMPDGFTPDVKVMDTPWDGYMLGDPEETMLKKVLDVINPSSGTAAHVSRRKARPSYEKIDFLREKPDFGMYILTKGELDNLRK